MGRTSIPWLHTPITTAQTVAPNDVTSARLKHLYLGYFGFIFVQWEEVETRRPSLYIFYGVDGHVLPLLEPALQEQAETVGK